MAATTKNPVTRTRVHVGDTVQIIAGKEAAGRKRRLAEGEEARARQPRGKVLHIDRVKNRALVQGLRIVKKHQRASQDPGQPNVGRVEKEAPVHLSDLMVVCPKCDEATRIGVRAEQHERADGKTKTRRIRVCKKCGADIPEK